MPVSIDVGTYVKFKPVIECEEMKNEISWTPKLRYQNITMMNEYENKSPEELRVEDYTVSRISPYHVCIKYVLLYYFYYIIILWYCIFFHP